MSGHHEPIRSCVMHVSVTHLIYPVTEKVLGQIFDAYGVNDVCLLQQPTHLDVFVEFQSWHEASQARDALHGRCIYDGCYLLDIQHAPPSISVHRLPNSESVVVDWDRVEVEPLASSSTPSSSTSAPAAAATTSVAICKVSTEVHADMAHPVIVKAIDKEEVVALPAAPHGTSSAATTEVKEAREDVFPDDAGSKHHFVMQVPAGTDQVLDRMLAMSDDKEQVQVNNELFGAPDVYDIMTERNRNGERLHRFVKCVSRVRIPRRHMRWVLRSKFSNSATTPSPPPVPPHPPDQPVHHLDPCSPPWKPPPPRPPDSLSGIGFVTTHMMLDSHIAHMAQLSFEQQRRGKVHGDSYILERLLGSATSVVAIEKMCPIVRSFFCSRDKQTIIHTYLVPSVQDYCPKSDDTVATSGCLYQTHALVHFYEALGATTCGIACQFEWLICSIVKLNYITDKCSYRAKNGTIISAELFEQWEPGINHAFSNLVYLVEKRFRLRVAYVDMRKRWYVGSKLHISEAIGGVVYDGVHRCRYDALMFIHVLQPADVWCISYGQTYLSKLWRYDKIIGDRAKLCATYKSTRTCIQLAPSGILLFVSLLPVYWYCTVRETTKKAMEIVAQCYLSVQSDDPPQDNCCLVLESTVIHTVLADGYSSIWLQNIKILVHLCMRFSTIGYRFRLSTLLILLNASWPNILTLSLTEEPPLHMTSHFLLETIPPWQRNAFSPGPSTVKCKEHDLARSDLLVKNQLAVLILRRYSLLVKLQVPRLVTRKCCPDIL